MFARSIIGKDKTPVVYPTPPDSQNFHTFTFNSTGRFQMNVNSTKDASKEFGSIWVVYHSRSGSTNIGSTTNTAALNFFLDIHKTGPVNGKEYTANTVFGSGDFIRGIIYGDKRPFVFRNIPISGSSPTDITLTNLNSSNRYHFYSYSYVGSGTSRIYNLNHQYSSTYPTSFTATPSNLGYRATSA